MPRLIDRRGRQRLRALVLGIVGATTALLIFTQCSLTGGAVSARAPSEGGRRQAAPAGRLHSISAIPEIFAGATTLLAALAATGLFIFGRVRRRRREQKAATPPWVRAHRELDRLARLDLSSEGKHREFYEGVSRLVRRYIEEMYDLKATGQANEEFLHAVKRSYRLGKRNRTLSKLLAHCDLLKFAAYLPLQDEVDGAIASCRELIDSTSRDASGKNR